MKWFEVNEVKTETKVKVTAGFFITFDVIDVIQHGLQKAVWNVTHYEIKVGLGVNVPYSEDNLYSGIECTTWILNKLKRLKYGQWISNHECTVCDLFGWCD